MRLSKYVRSHLVGAGGFDELEPFSAIKKDFDAKGDASLSTDNYIEVNACLCLTSMISIVTYLSLFLLVCNVSTTRWRCPLYWPCLRLLCSSMTATAATKDASTKMPARTRSMACMSVSWAPALSAKD